MRLLGTHVVSSLSFVLVSTFASAQNLVPNHSFEEFVVCPGNYLQSPKEFRVPGWTSANFGTPDHFHSCGRGEADVPHNWAGASDAYDGVGYAGIFLILNINNQYQEYLQSQLSEPLIKDTVYHVEFHYRLSSYSRFAVDRIGLVLTDSMIQSQTDKFIELTPTLAVVKDSALTTETGSWETASMFYRAKGNERFLTIGNFWSYGRTKQYKIKFRAVGNEMLELGSYYYIDDVKVIPKYILDQEQRQQIIPVFSIPTATVNTNYVLKNIQFQLNSSRLVSPSFHELDELTFFLKKNPKLKIQLFGHTDDQGSDRYNQRLSENRASTVALYLQQNGVPASRMETFGFGESKPLINEITEQARTVNRRVEIRFVE